ncbi:hypothetical protein os4_23310 [Comamonadaceae bacterium OS-4]|nr:hypothetical protein os4_23310 [Comamonadaceae bacterium OS-4]
METKIPFTSYDFWAYLSAGFLLLVTADYVAGSKLLTRDTWTVVQGVVAFSCAYVAGHVIASLSSFLFERLLVGKLLGTPKDVLFGATKAPRFIKFLLSGYFQPLPDETTNLVHSKAASMNAGASSESRFQVAFTSIKTTPAVLARLDNFLNMYGFCRNVALVSFLDAALLYWFWRWGGGTAEALTGVYVALALGVGMTLRYLKFFRQYASEVFNSFAYAKEPEKAK